MCNKTYNSQKKNNRIHEYMYMYQQQFSGKQQNDWLASVDRRIDGSIVNGVVVFHRCLSSHLCYTSLCYMNEVSTRLDQPVELN